MAYLSRTVIGIQQFLQTDGTCDCMEFIKEAPIIRNSANKDNCYTSIGKHANRRNMVEDGKSSAYKSKVVMAYLPKATL